MMGWDDALIMLAISLAISATAYMLQPKPKSAKPASATDLQAPSAEAGRPIPVVFGTITVKGGNILWFGDKRVHEYEI